MTEQRRVSFSPPDITQAEIDEVVDTLTSGWITTGPKTKEFERELAAFTSADRVASFSSATAADPDLYKQLVEAALAREKEDMGAAIGTLLDGLPNPVQVLAVNAPSVVDGINDYAHDHGCDLIVMGSRGLGVLRGMLGSVSYGVLRSADVPVLIAKEAEKE